MPPGFAIPTAWAGSRKTGALWTAVNERDELGSDLVPDYMTSVKDDFYGWPYSYYGQHVDPRVPAKPEMVAKAVVPDYALGNHTASLGLTFDTGSVLPDPYRGSAFVGQHGSWLSRIAGAEAALAVPSIRIRPYFTVALSHNCPPSARQPEPEKPMRKRGGRVFRALRHYYAK